MTQKQVDIKTRGTQGTNDGCGFNMPSLLRKGKSLTSTLPPNSSTLAPLKNQMVSNVSDGVPCQRPTEARSRCSPLNAAERLKLELIGTEVLEPLWNHEAAREFGIPMMDLHPEFKDYKEWISYPTDLATITYKLRSRLYPSADSCVRDIEIMFDNCSLYPKTPHSLTNKAQQLKTLFVNKVKKMYRQCDVHESGGAYPKLQPAKTAKHMSPFSPKPRGHPRKKEENRTEEEANPAINWAGEKRHGTKRPLEELADTTDTDSDSDSDTRRLEKILEVEVLCGNYLKEYCSLVNEHTEKQKAKKEKRRKKKCKADEGALLGATSCAPPAMSEDILPEESTSYVRYLTRSSPNSASPELAECKDDMPFFRENVKGEKTEVASLDAEPCGLPRELLDEFKKVLLGNHDESDDVMLSPFP